MELLFSRRGGISGSLYCIIPFKAKKGSVTPCCQV